MLKSIPLRTPAEAAEIRVQRQFVFSPNGRVVARGAGGHKARNESGDVSLDVQVQIEQAVMVDYHPRAHRVPRMLWDRRPSGIPNGDSADRGHWELAASVNKPGDDSWP